MCNFGPKYVKILNKTGEALNKSSQNCKIQGKIYKHFEEKWENNFLCKL